MLQDAAGHRAQALATLRGLQRPDVPSSVRAAVDKAVARLATAPR
jgi:hypothetical protein